MTEDKGRGLIVITIFLILGPNFINIREKKLHRRGPYGAFIILCMIRLRGGGIQSKLQRCRRGNRGKQVR